MSWLRIDDKFGQHPKVLGLTDREFRVHVIALCYCAEYRTDGHVPRSAWRTIGVTPKIATTFVSIGLWDEIDGDYSIHDFRKYNPVDPTAAERKSRERSRKSHGDVTETSREESRSSRAGARARPVPSPTQTQEPKGSLVTETTPKTPRPLRDETAKNGLEGITSPTYFALLHAACGSTDDALEKLTRASKGKPEATIVVAFEAATGPGVREPLAVALAELGRTERT